LRPSGTFLRDSRPILWRDFTIGKLIKGNTLGQIDGGRLRLVLSHRRLRVHESLNPLQCERVVDRRGKMRIGCPSTGRCGGWISRPRSITCANRRRFPQVISRRVSPALTRDCHRRGRRPLPAAPRGDRDKQPPHDRTAIPVSGDLVYHRCSGGDRPLATNNDGAAASARC